MELFTPTTQQVRDGYAVDPEADYRDPTTNHTLHGQMAFDRWLAAHDAEVRAAAIEEVAQFLEHRHDVLFEAGRRLWELGGMTEETKAGRQGLWLSTASGGVKRAVDVVRRVLGGRRG